MQKIVVQAKVTRKVLTYRSGPSPVLSFITLITYQFSCYSSLVLLAFVLACACVPPSLQPSVHVLLAYQQHIIHNGIMKINWTLLRELVRRLRRCNATTEIFRPLNILTNQGTKNICVPGFQSVVQP